MASIDQTIEQLADDFALLPDWEERISYVIELARTLLKDAAREATEAGLNPAEVRRLFLETLNESP